MLNQFIIPFTFTLTLISSGTQTQMFSFSLMYLQTVSHLCRQLPNLLSSFPAVRAKNCFVWYLWRNFEDLSACTSETRPRSAWVWLLCSALFCTPLFKTDINGQMAEKKQATVVRLDVLLALFFLMGLRSDAEQMSHLYNIYPKMTLLNCNYANWHCVRGECVF